MKGVAHAPRPDFHRGLLSVIPAPSQVRLYEHGRIEGPSLFSCEIPLVFWGLKPVWAVPIDMSM